MPLYTYDPKDLVLTVGGVAISGYADGEFVSVERTNDAFSMVSGADGDVSRAKSNDKTGAITITLAQTSLSNDVLAGFARLDEESNDGVVPVIAKDLNGTSVFFSGSAWVRKVPASAFAKEIQTREWVLDCADLEIHVGGTVPNTI
jgi:hypothetical protein